MTLHAVSKARVARIGRRISTRPAKLLTHGPVQMLSVGEEFRGVWYRSDLNAKSRSPQILNRNPMPTTSSRVLKTRRHTIQLPVFLPVYQPHKETATLREWQRDFGIEGCIVNAYFLYKDREMRQRFKDGLELHDYIDFDGLIMTDSGAFQGFNRPLLLANKKIVAFQDAIGADVLSPLDLVTPPGDKRTVAERKLNATQKRIREAKRYCHQGMLAGVQQGGRFRDLRRRSVEEIMEIGVDYLAIGSLVPFFNRNHNLQFVADIVREARTIAGPEMPMHIFGAGDPVELPFFAALGADIFDSSSYGHYAAGGWYMTPYGAVKDHATLQLSGFNCSCAICVNRESSTIPEALPEADLRLHNLCTILKTLERIRTAQATGEIEGMLTDILERHAVCFPGSDLPESWATCNTPDVERT